MAIIKKLKDNELIGGIDNTDVYPVTHTRAVYDATNRTLDARLEENDNDRNTLHEQSERLVPSIMLSPDNTLYELTGEEKSINISASASIEVFGDSGKRLLNVIDYTPSLLINEVPQQYRFTSSDVITTYTLPRRVGTILINFTANYKGIEKSDIVKINYNARKFFGFDAEFPRQIELLGANDFSNSVECEVTIPAKDEGYQYIYLAVPQPMVISEVLQPDALNAPLAIDSNFVVIGRTLGGTVIQYNVYKSLDLIDSSRSKRLIIK